MREFEPERAPQDDALAEEDERFAVHSRAERLAILGRLCNDGALITVQAAGSADFMLSAILRVDAASDSICFDVARDPAKNRRIQSAERLQFVTEQDGVRIRFATPPPLLIDDQGSPAFTVALPRFVVRVQRREYFRVAPPLNRPVLATLRLASEGTVEKWDARALDISCGGIVLLIEGDLQRLAIGEVLSEVGIMLPDEGSLQTRLEVRNCQYAPGGSPQGRTRLGCRFVDMSPTECAKIQRYVNRLEVELRRHT